MRISSIDIGTNTVLLLVADVESDGAVKPLAHGHEIARIGKGVDRTKKISPEGIDRLRVILREYVEISRKHGAERIVACGTSALRDAENREAFRETILQEFGINVVVLSGEEEARLSYLGALSEFDDRDATFAVLDIGGGSTEITVGTGEHFDMSLSLDLGCVRLTERYLKSIPPSKNAVAEVTSVIREQLGRIESIPAGSRLVGVAGTVTTLAAMDLQLPKYDPLRVNGHRLSLATIERMYDDLSAKTLDQIKAVRQIHPERADILLAGVVILIEVMKRIGWKEITASDRGLRYGFAMREAGGRNTRF
ncbi:MAG: Ppx/GppA family phosphatase [Ignavibacteriales bacterium]|nr:Ppx/GppA family phosphatase [Ignavibacteriales bacterium]